MATNPYFSHRVRSEQHLYEDITIESLKMYGTDVFYLPRDIVNRDKIFGADVVSRFNSSHVIEMYIENVDGFDGEGDLFSKFGIEIRDQATFIVARRRWNQTVGYDDNEVTSERPLEGDLIYLPLSNSMFQIMHVEHEQPFYQLSNLPMYKMRCKLYEPNDDDFDTGIPVIDGMESKGYTVDLTLTADPLRPFIVGETVTQTFANGNTLSGEVAAYDGDTNIVRLAHVGSPSGNYHEFIPGEIVGSFSSYTRTIISTDETFNQATAQNDDFQEESTDFLDFSESNPFGEPENN